MSDFVPYTPLWCPMCADPGHPLRYLQVPWPKPGDVIEADFRPHELRFKAPAVTRLAGPETNRFSLTGSSAIAPNQMRRGS